MVRFGHSEVNGTSQTQSSTEETTHAAINMDVISENRDINITDSISTTSANNAAISIASANNIAESCADNITSIDDSVDSDAEIITNSTPSDSANVCPDIENSIFSTNTINRQEISWIRAFYEFFLYCLPLYCMFGVTMGVLSVNRRVIDQYPLDLPYSLFLTENVLLVYAIYAIVNCRCTLLFQKYYAKRFSINSFVNLAAAGVGCTLVVAMKILIIRAIVQIAAKEWYSPVSLYISFILLITIFFLTYLDLFGDSIMGVKTVNKKYMQQKCHGLIHILSLLFYAIEILFLILFCIALAYDASISIGLGIAYLTQNKELTSKKFLIDLNIKWW